MRCLRTDRTITCWGGDDWRDQGDPPDGQFTAVSVSDSHSCGIRTDGTVECWGSNEHGEANPPSGAIHRRIRRPGLHVRSTNRQHHHMLGPNRRQTGTDGVQLTN